MSTKAFKGLKEVKIGTVGTITALAPLPGSMTKVGLVQGDGVSVDESDPEIEDLTECGASEPFDQNVKKGKITLKFQMAITSVDDLIAVRGGTEGVITAGGAAHLDQANFSLLEKAVQVSTPTANMYLAIPRANIYGKYTGALSDKGQMLVEVTITPLATGVSGVPSVIPVFPE